MRSGKNAARSGWLADLKLTWMMLKALSGDSDQFRHSFIFWLRTACRDWDASFRCIIVLVRVLPTAGFVAFAETGLTDISC